MEPRRKSILVSVLAVVVALAAGYGAGRLQGHLTAQELRQEKRQLTDRLERIDELEARRHLDLSLQSLESSNFGIAQKHLVAAARLLAQSTRDEGGELAELADQIGATNLVPTADAAEQRAHVAGFIARFDELVPPTFPAPGASN